MQICMIYRLKTDWQAMHKRDIKTHQFTLQESYKNVSDWLLMQPWLQYDLLCWSCVTCSKGRFPHRLSVHPVRLVHPFFPSWDTALHSLDLPPLPHILSSCTSPVAQVLVAENPSRSPSWLSVREKWTMFGRTQLQHSIHPTRLLAQYRFPLVECCMSIWGCIDRWFSRFHHRDGRS